MLKYFKGKLVWQKSLQQLCYTCWLMTQIHVFGFPPRIWSHLLAVFSLNETERNREQHSCSYSKCGFYWNPENSTARFCILSLSKYFISPWDISEQFVHHSKYAMTHRFLIDVPQLATPLYFLCSSLHRLLARK